VKMSSGLKCVGVMSSGVIFGGAGRYQTVLHPECLLDTRSFEQL
jgi:hypothetical protein